MGLQIQMIANESLDRLVPSSIDHLLPVFSNIYRATQQQTYTEGVASGTRRRHPGGEKFEGETANHGGEIAVCPLLL